MLLRCCAAAVCVFLILATPVSAQQPDTGKILPSSIREDLYSASFVSLDEGWVVGTFGAIYHTTDGGQSWDKQETGTLNPLFSVAFADPQHGLAVGKGGLAMHTEDGGRTWKEYFTSDRKHLFSIAAVSAQVAWAVGDWGKMMRTLDGGVTWEDRSLSEDVILYGINFADEKHGWIAGEVGSLFYTDDGGETWTKQTTATGKSLFGIHVADREHAWAVGLDGEIWQFSGGKWEQRPSVAAAALYAVTTDGTHGWIVGDNGTVLLSDDAGGSWRAAELPDELKLFWLHSVNVQTAANTTRGLITGANGLLLWIRNGQIIR